MSLGDIRAGPPSTGRSRGRRPGAPGQHTASRHGRARSAGCAGGFGGRAVRPVRGGEQPGRRRRSGGGPLAEAGRGPVRVRGGA